PGVKWEVVSTTKEMSGQVPVVTKKLVGHVDNSSYPQITVDIQLTLTTPANAKGPVPVILEFGLSAEALANIRKRFTEEQWANFVGTGPSWQEQLAAKGWGSAGRVSAAGEGGEGEGAGGGGL